MAVSREPHRLPLAHMTCCMRESLVFSAPFGGPKVVLLCRVGLVGAMPARVVAQVRPARLPGGNSVVSAIHWLSGRLPAGCEARGGLARKLGGTAYVSTVMGETSSVTEGVALFSEDVLLIVHCRMLLLV